MGDPGLIPASGRSPGEGNGYPLQYSCLENPMDRGAWWATVHGVAKSQTRLKDFTFTFFHMLVTAAAKLLQSCPTFATPQTAAYQAPPPMGFSRQEYRSGVPLPSPGLCFTTIFVGVFFVCLFVFYYPVLPALKIQKY